MCSRLPLGVHARVSACACVGGVYCVGNHVLSGIHWRICVRLSVCACSMSISIRIGSSSVSVFVGVSRGTCVCPTVYLSSRECTCVCRGCGFVCVPCAFWISVLYARSVLWWPCLYLPVYGAQRTALDWVLAGCGGSVLSGRRVYADTICRVLMLPFANGDSHQPHVCFSLSGSSCPSVSLPRFMYLLLWHQEHIGIRGERVSSTRR